MSVALLLLTLLLALLLTPLLFSLLLSTVLPPMPIDVDAKVATPLLLALCSVLDAPVHGAWCVVVGARCPVAGALSPVAAS